MQGLVRIARIHLIGFFVTTQNVVGRANGFTKRTVVAGGVFGGVGHDLCINEVALFQGFADKGNTAIHHIRGGDDVSTGLRMRKGLLYQYFNSNVVEYITGFFINNAVLAMAGKWVQGDIYNHP